MQMVGWWSNAPSERNMFELDALPPNSNENRGAPYLKRSLKLPEALSITRNDRTVDEVCMSNET
jgi:hypothetical protein